MLWHMPDPDDQRIFEELIAATDRAAAIVAAAFLDGCLTTTIRSYLVDDAKGNLIHNLVREGGPIGTLDTKTRLAFALGIFGASGLHDLKLVCKIRNRFAHQTGVYSFNMDPTKSDCANLKVIDQFVFDVREMPPKDERHPLLTMGISNRDQTLNNPRRRFMSTVGLFSTALYHARRTSMPEATLPF